MQWPLVFAATGCKILYGSNSNEKDISQMTLFELAYACRLFGKDDPYDILRLKPLGRTLTWLPTGISRAYWSS